MDRMTFIKTDTDSTVLEFVRAHFQIATNTSSQRVREAAATLVQANPQLANPKRIAAGEQIVVPADFDFPRKPGNVPVQSAIREQADRLADELAVTRRASRGRAGAAIAELDSSLQTLDQHRDLLIEHGREEELATLPDRLAAERQTMEAIADIHDRSLRRLAKSLDEFTAFLETGNR